jgi:GNAT superfamily N-acetyltransferase
MKQPSKRTFEFTYRDIEGGTYFYITLADRKQRERVRRAVGLKSREMLLSIRHFWIGPSLRGKGYGKRLMKQITGTLDALGHLCVLYVLPYDDNPLGKEGLVKFYEKAGFKQIGVAKGDTWAGCPIMVRGAI